MAIKQKDLAAHWEASAPYVSKCVSEGCPLDSFEAADSWRRTRSTRGVGSKSKKKAAGAAPNAGLAIAQPEPVAAPAPIPVQSSEAGPAVAPPAPSPLPSAPPAADGKLATLKAALAASIEVQSQAYQLVLDSMHGDLVQQEMLGIRITNYNKATEGRLKTEDAVLTLETKSRRLLPFEEHASMLSRSLLPLFSRLWNMGRRVAFKANPADPVLAEDVITQAIREACKEAQGEAFPADWNGEGALE